MFGQQIGETELGSFQMPSHPRFGGDGKQYLLRKVLQKSAEWGARTPEQDPQQASIRRLGGLAEELLEERAGSSPLAMVELQALLCCHCRRFAAVNGRCGGRGLEHCPLLQP